MGMARQVSEEVSYKPLLTLDCIYKGTRREEVKSMYRIIVEREARRVRFVVTERDMEELDWYLASLVGLGA